MRAAGALLCGRFPVDRSCVKLRSAAAPLRAAGPCAIGRPAFTASSAARLLRRLPMEKLEAMTVSATLADVPRLAAEILKGQIRGRVVVDVNR